jgi:hypothetical protein
MSTAPGDAWSDYLSAAQRLDAVRRGAASVATEQERTLRAARDEAGGVRARLAPQRARLRELGVPEEELNPDPAELAAAAAAVGGDPAAALAALRQARVTADAADAAVLGAPGAGPATAGAPAWARNLLVYGPFAATAFVVQLVLYLVADGASLLGYAAGCGLAMPAAAFGLGWLVTGLVFAPGPDGRVQRTALVGAVVCFAPVALTCVGVGVLALAR